MKIKFLAKKPMVKALAFVMIAFQAANGAAATEAPGNPEGKNSIPEQARVADVSRPDHIIGTGTPESCTADAFVEAVAQGGTIVFNGGTEPFTITLTEPAKIFNNANPDVIIDGGGLVTLSGDGKTRILYMNSCDPDQVWTTNHANNQDHPRLTVQNITFANGNSKNDTEHEGGGAIYVRGGRFKVINCCFINNQCAEKGSDVGGGAIRVFDQYEDLPVYVVNSTFGGEEGLGNKGANGGAISSIGVSWTIINCVFSYNEALGNGGNPAKAGTPGGGSGGAIYNDGNKMTLTILGSRIEYNKVNAYGSGIFFVTNNHTGNIVLDNTVVRNNTGGSWYPVVPDVSMHSDTKISITNSAVSGTAVPTTAAVLFNNKPVSMQAYNINGNNYYKLRDLALLLDGTEKQFDVCWEGETKTVMLTSGGRYTAIGGELTISGQQTKGQYNLSEQRVVLDGNTVSLTAYLIKDENYFKLRDVASAFDFGVVWDGQAKRILIDTSMPYQKE